MKIKDIQELLGVPASTYFDWKKSGHNKKNLAKLLENIELDTVENILKDAKKKQKPMMLLATVNCSIGNKKMHFNTTKLKQLLNKTNNFTLLEKYALKTIKLEALSEELDSFIDYHHIPKEKVMKAMSLV